MAGHGRSVLALLALAALAAACALLPGAAAAGPHFGAADQNYDPQGCIARLFDEESSGPNTLPTHVTNIFFVKVAPEFPTLDGDELCGLESAMRVFSKQQLEHPNITVCVYLLTTSDFIAPSTVESLHQLYGMRLNVLIWEDYMARWRRAGTIPHMINWFDSGKWKNGFVLNNLSNGMRLALLYNHGGAYFDLDIVHVRHPNNMTNFISWQLTGDLLNNAALRFQRHFGYMEMASKRFAENFNGKVWGHNGPKRLTETYREFCNVTAPDGTLQPERMPRWCDDMVLLPPQAYYPVYYKQRIQLYAEAEGRAVQLGADTYGVHLWKAMKKKVSHVSVVEVDSVFHKLARQVCPLTLIELGLEGLRPSRFAETGVQTTPEKLNRPVKKP